MTLNVAHRGDSGNFPESTKPAFESAIQIGADMVEFDVRATQDGELVVIHDETVDRITNGTGAVRELTLAEISQLDAGSWFDAKFAGERILTLSETLDLLPRWMGINMHLKCSSETDFQFDEKVSREINSRFLEDRIVVAADYVASIRTMIADNKHVPCRVFPAPDMNEKDYVTQTINLGLSSLQIGRRWATPEFVEMAHNFGLRVDLFYADEPEEMRQYIEMGMDAILTNYPARLKAVLEKIRASSDD